MAPESGTSTTVGDSAISGEIRQRFNADDELSGYGLGIRTSSGRVTLSGAVGSYPARDRAVELARTTNGVREVDNRIVVNTNL
jgi:osmotically-inducible protein OsmY